MKTKILIICVKRMTMFHATGPGWTLIIQEKAQAIWFAHFIQRIDYMSSCSRNKGLSSRYFSNRSGCACS